MARLVGTTMSDVVATRRPWLAGFAALNACSAWAGGIALMTGSIDFGEPIDGRLPFDSLVLAGLALVAGIAIPLTAVAWSAWTGGSSTDDLALLGGLLLIGWIVMQVVVIRSFSFFQPLYLAIGAAFVVASHRVALSDRHRGIVFVAVGAVFAAVGVGLLPHPIKNGLTVMAVVAVLALLAGSVLVVTGAVMALRGRRRLGALLGAVAVLVVLGLTVSIVAPAVAATVVPATDITTTPSALGLDAESLTLTTADGVDLAAWYVPGTNGAGVVMTHGAGSTRSNVLEEAAVIVGAGYAVLLIDARGHGDSTGTAMDFGWYGDLDITAAVGFLAGQDDVDVGRIGVVGFSMGGEEAIGAAAADPRIRAVVAEGATARQADDKEWLDDVYGWRGWVQQQVENLQDGVTDYLSESSPPISLRSAVVDASGARFLLITAGNVADEGHAAAYIRTGASDRVTVWNVDGAGHTDGYERQPDEWARRVVDFLDEALGEEAT